MKKAIDPARLNINVKRVMYTGGSSVVLEGDSFDADLIKNQLHNANSGLEVKNNILKNPRLIVHDVPVDLDASNIVDCIVN